MPNEINKMMQMPNQAPNQYKKVNDSSHQNNSEIIDVEIKEK